MACRHLGVLCFQRANNIHWRQLEVIQFVRVHPDTHRVLGTEQLNVAHAASTADGVLHVGRNVVGNIVLVHGAVGVDNTNNHQEAAGGFFNADTLLLNFLRQKRCRQSELVLYLYLSDIRIGTGFEGQGNGCGTGGVAVGGHVHQVIDTVHVLFDNLSDSVLHRFGVSTGIHGRDRNRRRRNRWILRYRQFEDR